VGGATTKQILAARNHFLLAVQNSGNRGWLSRDKQMTAQKPSDQVPGDNHMRTVSFILALAFVVAGPSMAGSVQSGLPGVGTFSYNGSPVVTQLPLVIAAN
jgi:hypothetical protein